MSTRTLKHVCKHAVRPTQRPSSFGRAQPVLAYIVMTYVVMAYIVMTSIVIAYIGIAYIGVVHTGMTYIGIAYIAMTYIVMTYVVMACPVMAYIAMAYTAMAYLASFFLVMTSNSLNASPSASSVALLSHNCEACRYTHPPGCLYTCLTPFRSLPARCSPSHPGSVSVSSGRTRGKFS